LVAEAKGAVVSVSAVEAKAAVALEFVEARMSMPTPAAPPAQRLVPLRMLEQL
jgi:hypothetical protein